MQPFNIFEYSLRAYYVLVLIAGDTVVKENRGKSPTSWKLFMVEKTDECYQK